MNTTNGIWEELSLSEFEESIELFNQRTNFISTYPKEFLSKRTQIVQWLIFISNNLAFREETAFLSIALFDFYISVIKEKALVKDIQLAAIACLSLAAKQEEINCNYTCFLTEKVLNDQQFPGKYTIKDLTKKEIDILIQLGFKTQISTPYHYTSAFLQMCFNIIDDTSVFESLIKVNEQNLLKNIALPQSLSIMPIHIALYTLNESLQVLFKQKQAQKIMFIIGQLLKKEYSCSQSEHQCLELNYKEKYAIKKAIKA